MWHSDSMYNLSMLQILMHYIYWSFDNLSCFRFRLNICIENKCDHSYIDGMPSRKILVILRKGKEKSWIFIFRARCTILSFLKKIFKFNILFCKKLEILCTLRMKFSPTYVIKMRVSKLFIIIKITGHMKQFKKSCLCFINLKNIFLSLSVNAFKFVFFEIIWIYIITITA